MPSRTIAVVPALLAAALLLTACTGEPAPAPATPGTSVPATPEASPTPIPEAASPTPAPEAAAPATPTAPATRTSPATPTSPAAELESERRPAWSEEQLWRACLDWREAEEERTGWQRPAGSWSPWDEMAIAQPQVGDVYDVQILGYFWDEGLQDEIGTMTSCTVEGSPEDHVVSATDPEKHHTG